MLNNLWGQCMCLDNDSVLNVKALVGALNQVKALVGTFNQEEALVGAFSVIVKLRRLIVCSSNNKPS